VSRSLLRFAIVACVAFAVLTHIVPAGATFGVGPWRPPVVGPVVKRFDPPRSRFGPGHLGVDYAVAPGMEVRAAGAGVVVFAARVGEGLHVVVAHDGGIRTTDSFLATSAVVVGQRVSLGQVVGTTGGTGPGHTSGVLHFGVRVGSDYVDPMLLFMPPDLARVVHLAPPRFGAASGDPTADRSSTAPDPSAERRAVVAGVGVEG
jgi:murein DD-endopeptidase MepM/ murein hydrolase activator NlpD